MTRGPSQSWSYMSAYGNGVSKGSWGSNSSTKRKNWSCAGAEVRIHSAAADMVLGPGKSSSARKYVRESS